MLLGWAPSSDLCELGRTVVGRYEQKPLTLFSFWIRPPPGRRSASTNTDVVRAIQVVQSNTIHHLGL